LDAATVPVYDSSTCCFHSLSFIRPVRLCKGTKASCKTHAIRIIFPRVRGAAINPTSKLMLLKKKSQITKSKLGPNLIQKLQEFICKTVKRRRQHDLKDVKLFYKPYKGDKSNLPNSFLEFAFWPSLLLKPLVTEHALAIRVFKV